ncbi:hypothetical protein Tco_0983689 [Tanacetum coccineum]
MICWSADLKSETTKDISIRSFIEVLVLNHYVPVRKILTSEGSSFREDEILLEPTSNKLMVEHAEFDESNTYVLERFDTSAGNPVKEILLKLSLPDHRSILTDSKVTLTNHGRMTNPYSSPRFIANYFNAEYLKMVDEVPDFQFDHKSIANMPIPDRTNIKTHESSSTCSKTRYLIFYVLREATSVKVSYQKMH